MTDFAWYKGCSPTATANLLYYWSAKGYSKLTANKTPNQVIEELAIKMKTSVDGGTYPNNKVSGMNSYIDLYYTSGLNGYMYNVTGYAGLKSEIDNNRPFILDLFGHPTYTDHSVTVFGYYYEDGQTAKYTIVRDTWPEPWIGGM